MCIRGKYIAELLQRPGNLRAGLPRVLKILRNRALVFNLLGDRVQSARKTTTRTGETTNAWIGLDLHRVAARDGIFALKRLLPGLVCVVLASRAWAIAAPELPSQAEWLHAMHAGQTLSLPSKVMRTRILFTNVAWSPDTNPDGHWATPAELLRKGSGDLLDLVTAYYFTLRGMGVPPGDMRMFFGRIRTLDEPVPHIMLALRGPGNTTYFVDPLRDTAMTDETPSEFRPTLALNETGTWRTGALTDMSVWSSSGNDPDNVPRWLGVCYSTLGMMGLLQPVASPVNFAEIETDPPAAGTARGKKPKAKTRSKPKSKSGVAISATTKIR